MWRTFLLAASLERLHPHSFHPPTRAQLPISRSLFAAFHLSCQTFPTKREVLNVRVQVKDEKDAVTCGPRVVSSTMTPPPQQSITLAIIQSKAIFYQCVADISGFARVPYQVTSRNRLFHEIQDRKTNFYSMLASNGDRPIKLFFVWVIFFFIYYLKKRKCSITSHTEMYCLRKKYIYIFHIFLLFSHFFLLFRKRFVILHQKPKLFFPFFFSFSKSGKSVGRRRRVAKTVSHFKTNKQTEKKNAQRNT